MIIFLSSAGSWVLSTVFKFSIRDWRPQTDLVLLDPGLAQATVPLGSDLAIHGPGPGPMQIKETNGLTITGQIRLFTYVSLRPWALHL